MYHSLVISILILISTLNVIIKSQSLYKYEVNIHGMEMPEKDLLFNFRTLRVKKFNRTTYTLDGYFDLLKPLSDDLWANAEIFAETGNDYKRLFEKRINNLCTFFKDDTIVISKIIHSTSLAPAIAECPIPVGRIVFDNTHMPAERLPLEPVITKGKVQLKIHSGELLMSELTLYFELVKMAMF